MPLFNAVDTIPLSDEQLLRVFKNFKLTDQIFQSQVFGIFNSGLFERLREQHPDQFQLQEVQLNDEFGRWIREFIELDGQVIKTMSAEQYNTPCSGCLLSGDPAPVLIDGHHRCYKRWVMGEEAAQVWVCSPCITELVNVIKGPL